MNLLAQQMRLGMIHEADFANQGYDGAIIPLLISAILCTINLQLTCTFPDCTRRVPISRALYFFLRLAAQTLSGVNLRLYQF